MRSTIHLPKQPSLRLDDHLTLHAATHCLKLLAGLINPGYRSADSKRNETKRILLMSSSDIVRATRLSSYILTQAVQHVSTTPENTPHISIQGSSAMGVLTPQAIIGS